MTDTNDVNPAPSRGNAGAVPSLPPGIWPTGVARIVARAVEVAQLHGHLGLICGASGVGKTTAASAAVTAIAVAGRYDDSETASDARYVAMRQTANELRPGVLHLCRSVGAPAGDAVPPDELFQGLVRFAWGARAVLVIDEAQFMSDGLLQAVRNLWDELDQQGRAMGIVLVGTPDLGARIKGRGARRGHDFAPFHGRLGVDIDLPAFAPADFAVIAESLGVAEGQAAGLLERIARGPGGLHNVRRVWKMARGMEGAARPVGLANLRAAADIAGGAR